MAQPPQSQQGPLRERRRFGPPLGAVLATMFAVIVWLVFLLLYALYWSKGMDLFQNLVVAFVSLAITGLAIGMVWVVWGYRRFGGFRDWSDWSPADGQQE